MANLTKSEMVRRFLDFITSEELNSLDERLTKLALEDRITTGAAFHIYTSSSWYGYQSMMKMLDRASKAKSYCTYISDQPKRDFLYYWDNIQTEYNRAKQFADEQEALPFEQTQMQLLIASGQLNNMEE